MKVLDTDFARSFIRMCNDGWTFGWHESNGGNASYRLRPEEVTEVRSGFRTRSWVRLDTEIPTLAGEFFLITSAGSHFRNIAHDPKRTLGIIEVDRTGTCWRECWGFKDGTHPTSELAAHLINHEVRKAATGGESRVLYHCHPTSLAAMTCVVPHDSAVFTRTLWAQLAECALVCRHGVEVIGWEVPGTIGLAIETAKAMEHTDAVIWPHHGLFVAGVTMDEAFGIAHTVEKAADIFCKARACGMPNVSRITDSDLVSFSRKYDLELARRHVYAKPHLDAPTPEPVIIREPARQEPSTLPLDGIRTSVPGTFRFPVPAPEPEPAPEPAPQPGPEPAPAGPLFTMAPAARPEQRSAPDPVGQGLAPAAHPEQRPVPEPAPQPESAPQPVQPAQPAPRPEPPQPLYRFYPKPRKR